MGAQVGTLFIFNSWIWFTIELGLTLVQLLYIWLSDQQKDLKGMIIHSDVIYEDHYLKNDRNVDSEAREAKEARDKRVKNVILFSRFSMVKGVPVFAHRFSCKKSTTVKADSVSALMQQISRTYGEDYTWEQSASPNMKYIWFICSLKGKTKFILPFDRKLSDSLPWYVVPLGVTDPGNPAQSRPFVWFLDDPKKEKVEFPELKDSKMTPMAAQTFVVGSSGGGKSSLLKVFLSHFVPIAKKDKSFKIYLADGKSVEFTPFKKLKEISSVTNTLEDLAKQTDEFVAEMLHMEHCMGIEGNMNQLPLDNHVDLKKTVILNGHMFLNDEEFEYKDTQGNIKKDKAINLVGRNDIAEINLPDFAPKEEEDDKRGMMW